MRLPTYITLKDVKKRWGHAQEDIFPVAQFEKLWSDMTGLAEVACRFMVVSRQRGQQLKDPAQLDGWLRDGSAAYVDGLVRVVGWATDANVVPAMRQKIRNAECRNPKQIRSRKLKG